MEDRPPICVDGMSTQAGWFPLRYTEMPSIDQLSALQKKMGGDAGAALQPPDTWTPVKDPLATDQILLRDGKEKNIVCEAFIRTLCSLPNLKVCARHRLLWTPRP